MHLSRDYPIAPNPSFPRRRESIMAFVDSRLLGNDGLNGFLMSKYACSWRIYFLISYYIYSKFSAFVSP